jgi:hypothetical protein
LIQNCLIEKNLLHKLRNVSYKWNICMPADGMGQPFTCVPDSSHALNVNTCRVTAVLFVLPLCSLQVWTWHYHLKHETSVMRKLEQRPNFSVMCTICEVKDSVIVIVNSLWSGRSGIQFPEGQGVCFISKTSILAQRPTACYLVDTKGGPCLAMKQPVCEVD